MELHSEELLKNFEGPPSNVFVRVAVLATDPSGTALDTVTDLLKASFLSHWRISTFPRVSA
jgi:hypothetical protein